MGCQLLFRLVLLHSPHVQSNKRRKEEPTVLSHGVGPGHFSRPLRMMKVSSPQLSPDSLIKEISHFHGSFVPLFKQAHCILGHHVTAMLLARQQREQQLMSTALHCSAADAARTQSQLSQTINYTDLSGQRCKEEI